VSGGASRLARLIRGEAAEPGGAAPGAAVESARPIRGGAAAETSATAASDEPAIGAAERCELCGQPVPSEHRHLLDLEARSFLCACRSCALLFQHDAAGAGHYRLVPEEVRLLPDFRLDDAAWGRLGIPVELAFFFHSSAVGRVVAFYPGPMGATESQLHLDGWQELVAENPVLGTLAPDVQALLVSRRSATADRSSPAVGDSRPEVSRSREAREHYLVPIDRCYALAGLMRTRWRGLSGGAEVWAAIDDFFRELRAQGTPARAGAAARDH